MINIYVFMMLHESLFVQDECMICVYVYGNGNRFVQDECMIHVCVYGTS